LAAGQGDAVAQFSLGVMHAGGRGRGQERCGSRPMVSAGGRARARRRTVQPWRDA
jgi:hypothetical protein